jgi:hypothetical protein
VKLELTPRRILAGGWVVFLLYAWPGYLMTDGAEQLAAAASRKGRFDDWHAVVMTEVWRMIGRLIAGPAGMLVLQSGLLLFGTYAIVRHLASERTAAWTAVAILLFPPLVTTTGLVSAEAQLAGFFAAGAAGLMSPRRNRRLLGLGALLLGIGMRDGVALAALPIVLGLFAWGDVSVWRRRGLAIAAWIAITLGAFGLERLLVNKHTFQPEERLAVNDIVNILRNAPPIPDARLHELLAGTPLLVATDIQQHAATERIFAADSTVPQRKALIAARRALIREQPGAWLAHRGRRLHAELGLPPSRDWPALYTSFVDSPEQAKDIAHWSRHSFVQRVLIAPVRWLSETPLFRPYVYAILALLLLPLAIAWRQRVPVVLLASGLLYELSLGVVSVRPAYRDSHWMIVATMLAAVLLVIHRARTDEKAGV